VKERILFVDDEVEVLGGLERAMWSKRDVWELEFVTSGEAALAALNARPFDAVVTDLRMPRMSGMELLAELARLHPRVGRIILTVAMDRKTVDEGRQLAQDYLVKPCNAETLIAVISVRLGIERLARRRGTTSITSPPPPIAQPAMVPVDLNRAIENAIATTRMEWIDVAEMKTELALDLAPVPCLVPEIHLVMMNMIVNAAHAIAHSTVHGGVKGMIRIGTRKNGPATEIHFEDSATWIPASVRDRLFDPSDWDEGPGPWLAVAYDVIRRNGGDLTFKSTRGAGTTFVISLPS
jgi:DNA-binding NarL/FixJ family response regulator